MKNSMRQLRKTLFFLLYCHFVMTATAQDGYWQRSDVKEEMTDIQKLIKNTYKNFNPAHHKFSGKTGDMGMNFEYIYYSTIDRKNHTYRGHVAWEWSNPNTMNPGDKLTVKGIVSNLTGESGSASAYVNMGAAGFMKPEAGYPGYASPNSTIKMAGTAIIPKPGIDRNGKLIPYLYVKFGLSGGNEFRWVERTIIYKWIPTIKQNLPSNSTGINGIYNTNFNQMSLSITGNKVTGTYKWNDGRIEGTLNGTVLTGWWYQSNGKGKFIFNFNNNFTAFTGKWGYNDNNPSNAWNGTKTSN